MGTQPRQGYVRVGRLAPGDEVAMARARRPRSCKSGKVRHPSEADALASESARELVTA